MRYFQFHQMICPHKITRVALDMDGVIANFCKAARAAMGDPYPKEPFQIPDGWLDNNDKNLWVYCKGHNFWKNIKPFPWHKKLIKVVDDNCDDWRFITKPSNDVGSYSGKYEWIKEHTKGGIDKLWMVNGSKAYACTGPHHLLIDDNTKNCEEWRAAGGAAYQWSEISANWPEKEVQKRLDEIEELLQN